MTEAEYLARVRALCAEQHARRVVLFGSRGRGDNAPTSDFDIAVFGADDPTALAERIDEIPSLYATDLIDMDTCANPALVREVERDGVLL
jgi:predicted nucleotidyltransferase